MGTKTHILHSAKLINNCPECYGTEGMELTFSQSEKENAFFRKPEKNITDALYCHTCNQAIYPVNWTDDIERVYQYNKKLAEEQKLKMKYKPLFYGVVVFDLLIIAGIVWYFYLR